MRAFLDPWNVSAYGGLLRSRRLPDTSRAESVTHKQGSLRDSLSQVAGFEVKTPDAALLRSLFNM